MFIVRPNKQSKRCTFIPRIIFKQKFEFRKSTHWRNQVWYVCVTSRKILQSSLLFLGNAITWILDHFLKLERLLANIDCIRHQHPIRLLSHFEPASLLAPFELGVSIGKGQPRPITRMLSYQGLCFKWTICDSFVEKMFQTRRMIDPKVDVTLVIRRVFNGERIRLRRSHLFQKCHPKNISLCKRQ